MKEVISYIKPRIVKITCPDTDSKGTGFLISKEGHIATNFHVIAKLIKNGENIQPAYSSNILISLYQKGDFKAEILSNKQSPDSILHDYAILKIDAKEELPFFELNKSFIFEEGERIYFGGFPLTQNNLTSHTGLISSIRETQTNFGIKTQQVIDIDATVVGGNSGGPLIIKKEDKYLVIGIISQQVALITKSFNQLEQFLSVQMTNPNSGGVFIGGVNPNAALFETIRVIKSNLSTGIGTAISIEYLKKEFNSVTDGDKK
jgi:S1-C subfamily serine protease